MADKQFLEQLSKRLADEGKLIEAGWVAFRLVLMPNAPGDVLEIVRLAYMSGAQHLFASMVRMMDPGTDETLADLRRMDLIDAELSAFADELKLLTSRSQGQA